MSEIHDWNLDDEDDEERWMLEREAEDEAEANRGTAACDGYCHPQCIWCLLAHDCPRQCGGGDQCPYVIQEAKEKAGA